MTDHGGLTLRPGERLLPISQVAVRLGTSRSTLARRLQRSPEFAAEIGATQLGGRWYARVIDPHHLREQDDQ